MVASCPAAGERPLDRKTLIQVDQTLHPCWRGWYLGATAAKLFTIGRLRPQTCSAHPWPVTQRVTPFLPRSIHHKMLNSNP